jgi:hypothetical protein
VLSAGLCTLPLAPVSAVAEPDLPRVIERMKLRIEAEVDQPRADELWAATDILMGLRYSEATGQALLEGVRTMEDSVTCQGILRKGAARGGLRGRVDGARDALMKM